MRRGARIKRQDRSRISLPGSYPQGVTSLAFHGEAQGTFGTGQAGAANDDLLPGFRLASVDLGHAPDVWPVDSLDRRDDELCAGGDDEYVGCLGFDSLRIGRF